jgi:ATP-dependent Clp protease protease subunit
MMSDDDKKDAPKDGAGAIVEGGLFKARTILLTGEMSTTNRARHDRAAAGDGGRGRRPDHADRLLARRPCRIRRHDPRHDQVHPPEVRMVGTGWVASAGALIYVAAEKKNRFCTPNTRFLLHEPRGGVGGTASDIDIQVKEILRMRERLNRHLRRGDRPDAREDRGGHRPRLLDERRRGWSYGVVGQIVNNVDEIS